MSPSPIRILLMESVSCRFEHDFDNGFFINTNPLSFQFCSFDGMRNEPYERSLSPSICPLTNPAFAGRSVHSLFVIDFKNLSFCTFKVHCLHHYFSNI